MSQLSVDRLARQSVIALCVLAIIVALKAAEDIAAPALLALVIGVVLSPVSNFLERIRLPNVIVALLTLVFALSVLTFLGVMLDPIVRDLVAQAPVILAELRKWIAEVQSLLQGIMEFSTEVSDVIGTVRDEAATPKIPSPYRALAFAPGFLAQLLIFVGTLFFFVLTRHDTYDWIARTIMRNGGTAQIRASLVTAEHRVSRYFLTISLINTVFGATVATAMHVIDMPGALLWGTVATILNFVLYLGPAIVATCLAIAGVVVFDGLLALLPVTTFVALNLAEGQFVTPALIGRQMALHPLLVFLALVFGLWIWGPVGGFIAIPVLVWSKALMREG